MSTEELVLPPAPPDDAAAVVVSAPTTAAASKPRPEGAPRPVASVAALNRERRQTCVTRRAENAVRVRVIPLSLLTVARVVYASVCVRVRVVCVRVVSPLGP